MLTLENISFSVRGKSLVDNVSVQFKAGQLNLIVGPNGAGKSTLVKLMSGQLHATAGKTYFGLDEASKVSLKDFSKFRAVLSQQIDLAFPLKVWEVVMMGRYPHFVTQPSEQDQKACEEAMRFFDVWNMAERNYLTLSGGEKQRVQFARVMAQIWFSVPDQPRYLLLDEPLTFLDIHYQFQFMKQLRQLLEDPSLVVVGVVHDLNLAARFADTILLLNHGKTVAFGEPKKALTSDNIYHTFHLSAEVIARNEQFYLYFE